MAATDGQRAAALEAVQSYCGWHIAPSKTETRTVWGTDTGTFLLPSMHVTAVASVVVGGAALDPAAYRWTLSGIVSRVWGWWPRAESATVTFTHGYPLFPAAVWQIVERVAQRAADDPGALQQVGQVRYASVSGVGIGSSLSDLDRRDLNAYRLPPIG